MPVARSLRSQRSGPHASTADAGGAPASSRSTRRMGWRPSGSPEDHPSAGERPGSLSVLQEALLAGLALKAD